MQHNAVGWFEIPVANMDRAVSFYETVFEIKLHRQPMGPLDMAWFPWVDNKPGAPGSLVQHEEFYKPSPDGALLYFSSQDVNRELGRIEAAGGQILQGRTLIADDIGYMAVFMDTEGNRLALHSRG